jgi:hypothetical protein
MSLRKFLQKLEPFFNISALATTLSFVTFYLTAPQSLKSFLQFSYMEKKSWIISMKSLAPGFMFFTEKD